MNITRLLVASHARVKRVGNDCGHLENEEVFPSVHLPQCMMGIMLNQAI